MSNQEPPVAVREVIPDRVIAPEDIKKGADNETSIIADSVKLLATLLAAFGVIEASGVEIERFVNLWTLVITSGAGMVSLGALFWQRARQAGPRTQVRAVISAGNVSKTAAIEVAKQLGIKLPKTIERLPDDPPSLPIPASAASSALSTSQVPVAVRADPDAFDSYAAANNDK